MNEQIKEKRSDRQYSIIPTETAKRTFKSYERNHFAMFLSKEYGDKVTKELISKCNIGCARDGTLIWYQDSDNQYRTGQILTVDPHSGRINKVDEELVHEKFAQQYHLEFTYSGCAFGEHQILDSLLQPKGLVENPLLAIILSTLVKNIFWYAPPIQSHFDIRSFVSAYDQVQFFVFPDQKNLSTWSSALKDLPKDFVIVSNSLVDLYSQIEDSGLNKNAPHMQTLLARINEVIANETLS